MSALLRVDESVTSASAPRVEAPPSAAERWQSTVIFPGPRGLPGDQLVMVAVISGPTMTFELKKTLALNLRCAERECIASHGSLPVMGVGANPKEAVSDWAAMFEAQWIGLVERDESDLTEAARGARHALEAIARPIVVIA